ncbi:MAG: mechanosensitive ion channel, partial [Gammaproteobacteria bacterium]
MPALKLPRTVKLILVLALVAGASSATAQETPPSHPAWERIETLRAELSGLAAVDATATDEDAIATLERRLRLERELRDALGTLVAAVGTAEVDRDAVVAELERQARLLEKEVATLGTRIASVRGERDEAAPEALLDYEYRLRDLHGTLTGLLADMHENTARLDRLEVDTARHARTLDALLEARAARLAGRLGLAVDRIESTRARRKAASADQQGTIDVQLAALEERRDRLKDSLAALVDLMDRRGLETRELKELLFRASGEISGDLLDRDLLLGLLGAWLDEMRAALIENGPGWLFKLVVFVLIVLVARYAAKLCGRVVRRAVSAPHLAFSLLLQDFFVKLVSGLVLGLGLLIALSQLGIELAPLLAGLGVAGFILGFALQESLSNFASGMMILVYRPFDVGDVVEAGGVSGTVRHMSLVSTTINTFDNQKLVVPNNRIW